MPTLRAILTLDNAPFVKAMGDAMKHAEANAQTVERVGKRMSVALTAPIVAWGALVLKTGADFQSEMNKVGAISGATGDQFARMRDLAKDLGATTQFSAGEAAQGMQFLAQAGFDANQIVAALPGTLQLAAAGSLDLGSAADIASNVLTGFGLQAEEIGRVNDVLAKGFTSTNTNLVQLAEGMKYVAPVAAGMNVSLETTTAAIGLLSNAGIQASMAGTSLRRILGTLAEETSIAGVATKTATGQIRPLADVLGDLKARGFTAQQALEIFGDRAGPAMVALVSQGSDALRELETELQNAGGTAERIAAANMKGLAGAFKELRSALEGLRIAIFDSGFGDWAERVVRGAADMVRKLSDLNPAILRTGVVMGGVVAAAGPLLVALAQLPKLFAAVRVGAGLLSRSIGVLTGPVGWVTTAVITLHQAWSSNWGGIREKTAAAGEFLTKKFRDMQDRMADLETSGVTTASFLGRFAGTAATIYGRVVEATGSAWDFIVRQFERGKAVVQIAQTNMEFLGFVMEQSLKNLRLILSGVGLIVYGLMVEPFIDMLTPIGESLLTLGRFLRGAVAAMAEQLQPVVEFLRGLGVSVGNGLQSIGQTAVNRLSALVGTGIDNVRAAAVAVVEESDSVQEGLDRIEVGVREFERLSIVVSAAIDEQMATSRAAAEAAVANQDAATAAIQATGDAAEGAATGMGALATSTGKTADEADRATTALLNVEAVMRRIAGASERDAAGGLSSFLQGGLGAPQSPEAIAAFYAQFEKPIPLPGASGSAGPSFPIPDPSAYASLPPVLQLVGKAFSEVGGIVREVFVPGVNAGIEKVIPLPGILAKVAAAIGIPIPKAFASAGDEVKLAGDRFDETGGKVGAIYAPLVKVAQAIGIPIPKAFANAGNEVQLTGKKVGEFGGKVESVYQPLVNVADAIEVGIKPTVTYRNALGSTGDKFVTVGEQISDTIGIVGGFAQELSGLPGVAGQAFSLIAEAAQDAQGVISAFAKGTINGIVALVGTAIKWIVKAFDAAGAEARKRAEDIKSTTDGILSSIGGGTTTVIADALAADVGPGNFDVFRDRFATNLGAAINSAVQGAIAEQITKVFVLAKLQPLIEKLSGLLLSGKAVASSEVQGVLGQIGSASRNLQNTLPNVLYEINQGLAQNGLRNTERVPLLDAPTTVYPDGLNGMPGTLGEGNTYGGNVPWSAASLAPDLRGASASMNALASSIREEKRPMTILFQLDGRTLAESTVEHMPGVLKIVGAR